jgi:radical SAM protein with 4Fe4S-binding SPASM domain
VPAPVALAPVRVVDADEFRMYRRMSGIISNLQSLFGRQPIAGSNQPSVRLHHYIREEHGYKARLHLRLDPDGHGTLMINANRVVHFNPTAALMAHLALEETPQTEAIRAITRAYRVPKAQAESDYITFLADFEQIIRPDSCPVCAMDDLEISAPFSARPTAPYRMDLALTYRCNDDCAHCYNARPRDYPEISTAEWKRIIDKTWELGIPHIVFTGGEPTLREDLPELIAYAESNGQITGVNTNARRLSNPKFVEALVHAGLDHIQITVESHDPDIHDQMVGKRGAWRQTIQGLRNVLDTPLYVMTNTTMLQVNSPALGQTLDFLAAEGVPTIGLNALIYSGHGLSVGTGIREGELPPLLDLAREKTAEHGQRLIWYTPTQYCNFDPQQLELGVKGCTAALYNMCVEPDGGVLPCQSYYQQLGNLLKDPWEAIWNHELSVRLRERTYVPPVCKECALLAECGGGCPLAMEAQGQNLISIEKIAVLPLATDY